MRKTLVLAFLMALIWTGAEGQDPVIFSSGFESGDADEEWTTVVVRGEDQPPIVVIIAPASGSCGMYMDKRACNEQSLCRWDNRNDVCVADN